VLLSKSELRWLVGDINVSKHIEDFAFIRFMSNNLLTQEESQHKDEI